MRLYAHESATTSRAVLAFLEEEGLDVELVPVDISQGEHHQPPFTEVNPNRMIPVLDDGGFVLTESSAILRYLARTSGSALYPTDLKAAARVDELLAWFEANFYKDFGFQFVYPQLFEHHSRGSAAANDATVAFGRAQAQARLAVLDSHYLAHGGPWLTDQFSIADLHGASIVSLGELVGASLDAYPRVDAWYQRVTSRPSWTRINGAFAGFVQAMQGREFVGLS